MSTNQTLSFELRSILSALSGRNLMKSGKGWTAMCPAHDDKRNSLSINVGDTQPFVLKCHAGCTFEAIMAALKNPTTATPLGTPPPTKPTARTEVAAYPYTNERGALQYEAVRFEPKDFRQRRPDGNGGYHWNMQGVSYYLYCLHELRKKLSGREHPTVYIVEGERDADTLWSIKWPATTNVGGAGKWRPEYTEQLVAAKVEQAVIFPDNDAPGRTHADKVAAGLTTVGITVKVVHLDVPEKGDVSDYLASHSKDDLFQLVRSTATWAPDAGVEGDAPDGPTAARERFPDFTDVLHKDLFYGPDEQEEPLDYHWDGFTVRGSVVTILGAKKHTKTWFADLLGVSAAALEPIFPGFPCGGQRVLLISGPRENSEHETKRRLRAIHQQYGIKPEGGGEIRVRSYRRAALRLEKDDAVLFEALCVYVADFQPDMIRLDSTGALWGGKNENDSAEVREWMEKRLDVLLQHAAPGCTIYNLAHTGHAIRDGKQTFASRHQRGASGWGDSTDTLLMVEKIKAPDGAPDHHVVSTIGMEYTRLGPETQRRIQLTISGGPGTGQRLGVALEEALPEQASETDTEKALHLAVEALQRTGKATQAELKKIVMGTKDAPTGLKRDVVRAALWVLRGTAPWTAGQYKGTKRALVREDGEQNNSPVLVWVGHSGDMWGAPESGDA